MVFKKRLYYGFDDFCIPVVPRAPRSLRRRSSYGKPAENSQLCAFELLAAVAGKLLQENESSVSSSGPGGVEGKEQVNIDKEGIKQEVLSVNPVKSECIDQGSCTESLFVPDRAAEECKLKLSSKAMSRDESDSALERASSLTNSDFLLKGVCNLRSGISESKNGIGNSSSISNSGSPDYGESCDGSLVKGTETVIDAAKKNIGGMTVDDTCGRTPPLGLPVIASKQVISDSSVLLPFYGDLVPNASFTRHKDDVKLGIRDDDENSFRCNFHSSKIRAFRSQSRIGYRRIRKMLNSRYWKVAPKLRDYEISNSSSQLKPFNHIRKNIHSRERCQEEVPIKKRKLYNSTAYVHRATSEDMSHILEKGINGENRRPPAVLHRETGVTSSVIGHKTSFHSKDSHVKFSIKSFKVPELYVEVPETATVGSLKRTVMDAVTAILGGELRVGVLLKGKKVRDDNRTLQQTGISQSGNLDTLGFMLEPSCDPRSPSLPHKDPPFLQPCDARQHVSRLQSSPVMDSGFSNSSLPPSITDLEKHVKKDQDSKALIPFATDITTDEKVPDSKAIVSMSDINTEASMSPLKLKTKRSELSQRRTRRPFSVSEVEALVEAVEKLGTGRWRDVKIRAFDDANHRTYVDLKDKWKTLVHTASISPQQRRGEPVPQELLDRVLAAHAYWSQHQSKQHGKHHSDSLRSISDSPMEIVRV